MIGSISPEGRTAEAGAPPSAPVTLINGFLVPEGRDDVFVPLWMETSRYFRAQPGFLSLRLHRAATPEAPYRYVNVARWASHADYRTAHSTEEFRRVVTGEGWQEFPSNPLLYEVVVAVGDDAGAES